MFFVYLDHVINYGYFYLLIFLFLFYIFTPNGYSKLKLTPELIPYKMHYKNARSVLSMEDWKKVAKLTYKESNYKCDICGANDRLECHEVWGFNDRKKVQSLLSLTTLCPDCHRVKHIGLARKMGWFEDSIKHMAKINKISTKQAKKFVEYAEKEVKRKNKDYALDLTYLNRYRSILPRQYSNYENENCSMIDNNF